MRLKQCLKPRGVARQKGVELFAMLQMCPRVAPGGLQMGDDIAFGQNSQLSNELDGQRPP